MSYDQYVLPPQFAADAAAAMDYMDRQEELGELPATPEAAAFANRINAQLAGGLSVEPVEAEGAAVTVPVPYGTQARAIEVVHREAKVAGLAVFDLQCDVTFNPADAIEGEIASDSGRFPTLTAAAVDQLVSQLRVEGYVVAETDAGGPGPYMQTRRDGESEFVFEYNDGSPHFNYATTLTDVAEVRRLFAAWFAGDQETLAAVPWERFDF